jgi:Protein of unknown function (DUF1186)/SEC-C motif
MEPHAILYHLAHAEGLPEDAIRAAREQRDGTAPALVDFVERYLRGEARAREEEAALFFVFHLLGEWRETSAYRPLARLLAGPPDQLERVLGGAITETSHRVIAAVFDGDPRPLYEAIEAEHADEFARSRMLEALAMVTLGGGLDRAEAATYLRNAFMTLRPHGENFVWQGWQSAIALLGLKELSSLVKKAFERGLIGPEVMEYEDFRSDLKYALAHPEAPWQSSSVDEFTPFGDTIEELSRWYSFSPEYLESEAARSDEFGLAEPAVNPFRAVGRNDPCPCGSGRKFKKCCLA